VRARPIAPSACRRARNAAVHHCWSGHLLRFGERSLGWDSVALHRNFASKLLSWFIKDLSGPRVVISHTAPVINPNSKFKDSSLRPAFNSLDMMEIIETYQPDLWVYGHTHECDDQMIGKTRIISNQLGYPNNYSGFECKDFDGAGLPVDIGG
jgi:hypothetical protein